MLCNSENQQKLLQMEDTAKAAGVGKWSPPEEHSKHVRDVSWTIDNPRHYVDSQHGKPVEGQQISPTCFLYNWNKITCTVIVVKGCVI